MKGIGTTVLSFWTRMKSANATKFEAVINLQTNACQVGNIVLSIRQSVVVEVLEEKLE